MKLQSFSTHIIVLHLVTSSVFFAIPIQSAPLTHASLLDQICRQSPHYHLCVMTLRSSINHRSKADIAGFAHLIIEIANDNASIALEHARKVYSQTKDHELEGGMVASYDMIVNVHLREALNAMDKRDYNVVKQRVYTAGIQAMSCNNKYKHTQSSTLRDTNRYVHKLCAIALSIVNKLL